METEKVQICREMPVRHLPSFLNFSYAVLRCKQILKGSCRIQSASIYKTAFPKQSAPFLIRVSFKFHFIDIGIILNLRFVLNYRLRTKCLFFYAICPQLSCLKTKHPFLSRFCPQIPRLKTNRFIFNKILSSELLSKNKIPIF